MQLHVVWHAKCRRCVRGYRSFQLCHTLTQQLPSVKNAVAFLMKSSNACCTRGLMACACVPVRTMNKFYGCEGPLHAHFSVLKPSAPGAHPRECAALRIANFRLAPLVFGARIGITLAPIKSLFRSLVPSGSEPCFALRYPTMGSWESWTRFLMDPVI